MNRRRSIRAWGRLCALSAAGLLTAACAGAPEAPNVEASMWRHFGAAVEMQFAMVRGDLDAAQRAARRFEADREIRGLPPGSEVEVGRLKSYATNLRSTDDFEVAALATSLLAASCGDCHAEYDVGPGFGAVTIPEFDPDDSHMVAHVWAADRLWEGMVIPSAERWRAGARVLAEHAIPMELLEPGTTQYGLALKQLGMEAIDSEDLSDKARLYADILTTCATCHTGG